MNKINNQIDSLDDNWKGNLAGFNTAPIEKVSVGLIGIGNKGKAFILIVWLADRKRESNIMREI